MSNKLFYGSFKFILQRLVLVSPSSSLVLLLLGEGLLFIGRTGGILVGETSGLLVGRTCELRVGGTGGPLVLLGLLCRS